ncbi:MAG: DHHW family protein [Bacillota bacterium]|nr:DHHW family protein [Bacillota bacterium]
MNEKLKNKITAAVTAVLLLVISLFCILKPADDFSESERRLLAGAPKLTFESVFSSEFMEGFEAYSADQFPAREEFRGIKAFAEYNIFKKSDNNGVFQAEGHLSKIDYPGQPDMWLNASEKFRNIYDNFLKDTDCRVYLSIVPDKNYYIAGKNGYPTLDFDELAGYFRKEMDYAKYIDLTGQLSAEDYYRTDTHWRQEKITGAAGKLAESMGVISAGNCRINELDRPFYGVYRGQYAMPCEPDTIYYLSDEIIDGCRVTSYDTGMPVEKNMYDMEKAVGKDAYELFLSGSDALIVIENPAAEEKRELVMFRDSFGSSIAPLMTQGYSKITLVDIRYIQSSMLDAFINFENQDVLFLYSTALLNGSMALK